MNTTCIHCPKQAVSRGLCWACYAAARRQVRRGRATWEDLQSKGRCAPKMDRSQTPGKRKQFFVG